MKREILFRGNDCFGNWQEGCLKTDNKTYWYIDNSICIVSVDPESVGQFTGLTDKNGAKIFEGDIVAPYIYKLCRNYKLKVVFDFEMFGIECKEPFIPKFKSLHEFANKCNIANTPIEIIGNIYDNPELLNQSK